MGDCWWMAGGGSGNRGCFSVLERVRAICLLEALRGQEGPFLLRGVGGCLSLRGSGRGGGCLLLFGELGACVYT